MGKKRSLVTSAGSFVIAGVAMLGLATAAHAAEPPNSWGCGVDRPSSTSSNGWSVCSSMPSGHSQRVKLTCKDGFDGTNYTIYGPYVSKNGTRSNATCNQRETLTLVDVQGK